MAAQQYLEKPYGLGLFFSFTFDYAEPYLFVQSFTNSFSQHLCLRMYLKSPFPLFGVCVAFQVMV